MHLVPTGIRIDRVWESHREWITVDDEVYDEQISFHSMLARLKTDLVNMAHIKEPPSILNTTIHSVYSDLKKARVSFGQKIGSVKEITQSKNYNGYVGIIIQGSSLRARGSSDRRLANTRRVSSKSRRLRFEGSKKAILYVSPFSKHVQE